MGTSIQPWLMRFWIGSCIGRIKIRPVWAGWSTKWRFRNFRRIDSYPDDLTEGDREFFGRMEPQILDALNSNFPDGSRMTLGEAKQLSCDVMHREKQGLFIQSWFWHKNCPNIRGIPTADCLAAHRSQNRAASLATRQTPASFLCPCCGTPMKSSGGEFRPTRSDDEIRH